MLVKLSTGELYMSTGNEMNAWEDEWCSGGTTRGGIDEAVIDAPERTDYTF